MKGCHCF